MVLIVRGKLVDSILRIMSAWRTMFWSNSRSKPDGFLRAFFLYIIGSDERGSSCGP